MKTTEKYSDNNRKGSELILKESQILLPDHDQDQIHDNRNNRNN